MLGASLGTPCPRVMGSRCDHELVNSSVVTFGSLGEVMALACWLSPRVDAIHDGPTSVAVSGRESVRTPHNIPLLTSDGSTRHACIFMHDSHVAPRLSNFARQRAKFPVEITPRLAYYIPW